MNLVEKSYNRWAVQSERSKFWLSVYLAVFMLVGFMWAAGSEFVLSSKNDSIRQAKEAYAKVVTVCDSTTVFVNDNVFYKCVRVGVFEPEKIKTAMEGKVKDMHVVSTTDDGMNGGSGASVATRSP